MPYHDSSLDYVWSFHVLEHVANPLAALAEWFRVIAHGGCIYMGVPDRRRTFDHRRPLTEIAHMIDDYQNATTQCDATHIDDFVYGVDWKTFSPATAPADEKRARDELATIYHRSVAAGLEINIHFHTFELPTAVALIEAGNRESLWSGAIAITETAEEFPTSNPNGFLVVGRVRKRIGTRWKALWSPKGLRADAKRF